jgi:hypothetical protein
MDINVNHYNRSEEGGVAFIKLNLLHFDYYPSKINIKNEREKNGNISYISQIPKILISSNTLKKIKSHIKFSQ